MFSAINYFVITALLCSVVSSGSCVNCVDTAGVLAKFSLFDDNPGKLHSLRVRLLGKDAFNVNFEFPYYFEEDHGMSPELFKSRFMNATKLLSYSIFIYSTINIKLVFKIFDEEDSENLASCSWNERGTRNVGKKQYLSHPLALI